MNIFVGNLSRDVTEVELLNLFAQFGIVKSTKIVKNISTNESKGYGFVDMPVSSEAHAVIDSLNKKELKGKRLTVNQGRVQKPGPGKSKNKFLRFGNNKARKF